MNLTDNILYDVSRRFLLGEATQSLSMAHYIRSIKDLISSINTSNLSSRDSQRLEMILKNVNELEKSIKREQRQSRAPATVDDELSNYED